MQAFKLDYSCTVVSLTIPSPEYSSNSAEQLVVTTTEIELLSKEQAQLCETTNPTSCVCRQVLTECLFGPDSRGNFSHSNVTQAEANACDRAKCTCESHGLEEYLVVTENREMNAHDKIAKARE